MNAFFSDAWESWHVHGAARRRATQDRPRLNEFLGPPSETIFCIGNGPSLREQDLTPLNGQTCLLTNRAYEFLDRFQPSFSTTVFTDIDRMKDIAPKFLQSSARALFSINRLDASALACLELMQDHCFLMPAVRLRRFGFLPGLRVNYRDGFSADPRREVYLGFSVIFTAIQLATLMRPRRIVCLGIDMNYTGATGKNHAFGTTAYSTAFALDYEVHARSMFVLQRQVLAERGIELLDATPGGRVDVLRKVELGKVLGDAV